VAELASRLAGSSDIYDRRGRRPWSSVNYVTAHDGFTLNDLVSYDEKHNEANGEGGMDGPDDDLSWNCGVEGPTDEPDVLALRTRQKRNLLATLLLSQGMPMLLGGDEFGRSQGGNNNAYCQDSPLTWIDWDGRDEGDRSLTAFVRRLLQLRREHVVFHRTRFFVGRTIPGTDCKDIVWRRADGDPMSTDDWHDGAHRSLGVLLSGEAGRYHLSADGESEVDATFFLALNANDHPVEYRLPEELDASRAELLIDTAHDEGFDDGEDRELSSLLTVAARSMVVVRYPRED
jgi:glycogen operon protein